MREWATDGGRALRGEGAAVVRGQRSSKTATENQTPGADCGLAAVGAGAAEDKRARTDLAKGEAPGDAGLDDDVASPPDR